MTCPSCGTQSGDHTFECPFGLRPNAKAPSGTCENCGCTAFRHEEGCKTFDIHKNEGEPVKASAEYHPITAAEVCDKIAEQVAKIMRMYTAEYPEQAQLMGMPEKKFTVQIDVTVQGNKLPEKAHFSKVGFTNG
jgi:hypothetical protein